MAKIHTGCLHNTHQLAYRKVSYLPKYLYRKSVPSCRTIRSASIFSGWWVRDKIIDLYSDKYGTLLSFHYDLHNTELFLESYTVTKMTMKFPACQRTWTSTTPLYKIPYKTASAHLMYISTDSYALACIIFMHIHKTHNFCSHINFLNFQKFQSDLS